MRKEIWIIIFLFSVLNIVFVLMCVFKKKNGVESNAEYEYRISIQKKQAQIDSLQAIGDTLRIRISKDSLKFQQRLNRINKQINRLKSNVKKIDYKYYFVPQLDSVGERLYPSPATNR